MPEPSEQRTEHEPALGRKGQVARNADDDAEQQSQHGSYGYSRSDAHHASLAPCSRSGGASTRGAASLVHRRALQALAESGSSLVAFYLAAGQLFRVG
jgi:hypothetical protein